MDIVDPESLIMENSNKITCQDCFHNICWLAVGAAPLLILAMCLGAISYVIYLMVTTQ